MIKRCLIGFTVLISCFLFTSKVNASDVLFESTSDGFFYGGFTKENLQHIIDYNSLDTTTYDSIIIYHTKNSQSWHFLYIMFYKSSQESRLNISENTFKGIINKSSTFYYATDYRSFHENKGVQDMGTYTFNWTLSEETCEGMFLTSSEILYKGLVADALSTEQNKDPIIDKTSKTITIPVNYFYHDGEWQNYYLYFAAPSINNMNYSLKFEYLSKETNLPELPIELIIHDKIDDVHQHLANISNSKYTSGNGFGGGFSVNAGNFGGGGGGGRLDDDTDTNSCMATTPFTYSGSFANERIYGLAALSLNSCYDLTGKTLNDFNTEAIKITYSARIVDLNTEGELGSDEIGDMLEDIRNEHQLEQDSISFEIFAPVIKLVTDKLPIINQFNQILNQFNYNENFDTPPTFVVDIPYFNLKNIEVFNFRFFNDYRDYVLSLQCLVLAIFTGVKCYRIVSGYFGGGDSE